jgi:hypothetical protein
MADHKAHTHLEILLHGLFGQFQELASARTIYRDRLFHKDVDALLDSIREMNPAECRWRCKNSHITGIKAVHCLSVTVEADEPAILRHVHLIIVPFLQSFVTAGKPVFEDVSHGDELNRTVFDGQGI